MLQDPSLGQLNTFLTALADDIHAIDRSSVRAARRVFLLLRNKAPRLSKISLSEYL